MSFAIKALFPRARGRLAALVVRKIVIDKTNVYPRHIHDNANVDVMNGLLQRAKHAACGYPHVQSFVTRAYPRISQLKHLRENPFAPATPRPSVRTAHSCT